MLLPCKKPIPLRVTLFLLGFVAWFSLSSGCTLRTEAVPQVEVQPKPEMPKIPPASAEAAWIPDGYRVEVVLDGLQYPTSIEFDNADNMYVAEAGYVYGDAAAPARILQVKPDGEVAFVASGLSGPVNDLLWHQDKLFISHRGKISVLEDNGSLRHIVTGLPSLGDHHNNQLAVGPEGRIYFGQGTATNSGVVGLDNFMMGWLVQHPYFHDKPARTVQLKGKNFLTPNPMMMTAEETPPMVTTSSFHPFGEEGEIVEGVVKANGTILRMSPSGKNLEVYAWGLRNPYGVSFNAEGELYVAENGFDDRGSRPIANAADNLWKVEQGAWYGWPDFSSGVPVTDPRFKPEDTEQPDFLMEDHPPLGSPVMLFPEHTAVTKIAFSAGENFGFVGDLFVAEFGDMTPMTGDVPQPAGRRVTRINTRTGERHPFFHTRQAALGPKGQEYLATGGPKRPVEAYFSRDGNALYVTDLGAFEIVKAAAPVPTPFPATGVVWRIVREGTKVSTPPANLSMPPPKEGDAAR